MTLPDGNELRDGAATGADRAAAGEQDAPVGTALAETEAAVDPFTPKAAPAPEPAVARSFKSVVFDYSAHAAMIVGLIGFAWTVSDHVVTRQTAAQIEAPGPVVARAAATPGTEAAATAGKRDELSELRAANERMARDVDALRSQLGTLQAALGREPTPDQVRALAGDLEGVKAGLNTVKGETTTAIAALSGRLDQSQRDAAAKARPFAAGPPEHQGTDTTATGSIGPDATPAGGQPAQARPVQTRPSPGAEARAPSASNPAGKPAAPRLAGAEKADDEAARPAVLPGWVVREVYQGVALIEGRRGALEVVPGVSIPGAGIVKSIDRRGNGWTVTTTKGLLAYAAPPREVRRAPRDYYPDPRYGY